MLRLAFTRPRDSDRDGVVAEEGWTGRGLTLVTDPTQDTFDRFDRLLAYVTTRGGIGLWRSSLGRIPRLGGQRPQHTGEPCGHV